ncbi:MAG: tRNA (guanosine(37)-N1)-methyltransferase TrmD [Anaeroplasma sp.]|uniref:tRNA (guanosine(37)-N1)-methyltransferase TrmD n=1 Tax=Anaeroplasma sp. TaxID=1872523 RepID=UPI002A90F3D0|nr:tRNA (guanosine(37)-N1)-methyltransferase TrmD [Anaeroplasma sp.]MDY5983826.1 tRNA (guanosine(37)-N1)-methyltransferase TrmD [Anaeroplasma sp.]
MKIKILTLFPDMFTGFIDESIIKRAIEKGVVEVSLIDIRQYSQDKHKHVDDTPCGGGAGMVMAVDVVDRCIKANTNEHSHIVMMTPQGETYNQKKALELSKLDELVLLCGHYEGFDERIRSYVDEEVSIGDFVLTGGEIAAMVISDSVIRLLDHAIRKESYMEDSFSIGLLEYPQYTRPIEYDGMRVPDVLLSGNHKNIETFRKKESLRRTYKKRPDLLNKYKLNKEEEKLLKEIIEEEKV